MSWSSTLWAGAANSAAGRAWRHDTIVPVFSGTKGLVATCLPILIERRRLNVEAPVSEYWPEFAAQGKAGTLVRHLVSHTAGPPGVRGRVLSRADVLDHEGTATLVAADAPSAYGIGFALQTVQLPFGPPPDAFGHTGAGGSVHGAWPALRAGFSHAPYQRRDDDPDQRSISLLSALHDSVI